ncbi:MAG: AbrB/MazE/SpoVT family DNA-binding domain-containing protein [Oscillospiraceae bacterium]|jgi:antitoxin MazE|nr:AbrB/MazE/SpoVT family DNA-binding domain-containing protein [Oscillospiraceae bacterium]
MTAQTRIVPWGGSSGIRIPKDLLQAAHLSQSDDVQISVKSNGVILISAIAPPKARFRHKTIQERFANFNGDSREEELGWGLDVGGEVLDD